jgi:predicted DNA-binding transcriptional regulator AlpA
MLETENKTVCIWVDTAKISEHTGLSASWFNNKRSSGEGPPYVKVGSKVLYDVRKVDEWLVSRARSSTAEEEAA